MSNKKVLITGATSGIGESLACQYTHLNYDVIACGRNTRKLNHLNHHVCQTLSFDINDMRSVELAAKQVDMLDLLILNAGNCEYIDDVVAFDHALFSRVINTNLISMGNMLSAFLPKVKTGGRVVFISSSATILPFSRAQAYGASKAGVDYLANSLRRDLLSKNIGVTLVHPGFIKTALTDKNDFVMPFLMSSERAAEHIIHGVSACKDYLHFPKRLTLLLKLVACLPNTWWYKIIGQQAQNKELTQ